MHLVNIKNTVLSLMACVAAIALSGCTASVASSPEPVPSAPQQSQAAPSVPSMPAVPDGYDELANWTNGETLPEMTAYGSMVGVEIFIPYASYFEDGFVGVGPLGDSCIVAFYGDQQSAKQGLMSVVIMTRYNLDFEMILPEATSDEVKEFIDQMRPSCTPASGTSA